LQPRKALVEKHMKSKLAVKAYAGMLLTTLKVSRLQSIKQPGSIIIIIKNFNMIIPAQA